MGRLLADRPNIKNKATFASTIETLATKGWTPVTDKNRSLLKHLRAQGLVAACPAKGRVKVAPGVDFKPLRPRQGPRGKS